MKRIWTIKTVLALCGLLASAATANAATYTLTCDAIKAGNFTIVLRSFSLNLAGSGGTGMSARRSTAELTVRFAPGKSYQTFFAMQQENEVLRTCTLSQGGASGGTAARDNWTAEVVTKGSANKGKNNQPVQVSGDGGLEWKLVNATVTNLIAVGGEGPTSAGTEVNAPDGLIEATITAQQLQFEMK
jgi:hypothetical protein